MLDVILENYGYVSSSDTGSDGEDGFVTLQYYKHNKAYDDYYVVMYLNNVFHSGIRFVKNGDGIVCSSILFKTEQDLIDDLRKL